MKKIKDFVCSVEGFLVICTFICVLVLIYSTICMTICTFYGSRIYGLTTVVVEISKPNDKVTCQDFNGNLWQFEGVEDWCENDIATLIMNDKGTELIKDDEILDVRYGGYFEGWLENYEEIEILEGEDSL